MINCFNTNDFLYESVLFDKLLEVYNNRHQGRHYYIRMIANVGNPDFKNENAYDNNAYPDDGFRLLALYKYWNVIHYFFPKGEGLPGVCSYWNVFT